MTVSGRLPGLPSVILSAMAFFGLPPEPGLGPLWPLVRYLLCQGPIPLKTFAIFHTKPRAAAPGFSFRRSDPPLGVSGHQFHDESCCDKNGIKT